MSGPDVPRGDPLRELRLALAESDGDAGALSPDVRARLMSAALSARSPGQSSLPVERISGHEVFRRSVEQLDGLLADLTPAEWTRPALRDLDVQGLMGHLIGVESAFSAGLPGGADPAGGAASGEADHVASTQPTALAQAGRPPGATHRDWFQEASHSLALLDERADHHQLCNFYGIVLPLDQVLVVRGFEMWIHDEDIRRATGRPLERPDAGRLARMSELAVALLPAGVARVGGSDGGTVRLVLTGTGGGTWDVPLDGGRPGHQAARVGARVVVDVAQFCRVAADRTDQTGAGAIVTGEATLVATLLAGAASLALD